MRYAEWVWTIVWCVAGVPSMVVFLGVMGDSLTAPPIPDSVLYVIAAWVKADVKRLVEIIRAPRRPRKLQLVWVRE